jgi:hypothetical protein
MGVAGTGVGSKGVGGIVSVATTGVGGMEVLVGATATAFVVAVGTIGCRVVVGGLPLAGNLQAVAVSASITNSTQVKIILLFMVAS